MKKAEKTIFIILAVLVFGGVAWLQYQTSSIKGRNEKGRVFITGPLQFLPAPDFTLQDLDGRPVRLSDFRGSVVLLEFWATW